MRRVARRACKRNAAATSARSTVRRPGRTIGSLTRGPARRGLACAIPRVARRDTRRLLARPDACTLPRTGPPARKRRTAVRARATAAVIALIFLRAVDGCGHSARASAALKCSNSSTHCSASGRRASHGATRAYRRRGLSSKSTHDAHRMGRHVGTGVERDGQRAGTCEYCVALRDLQSEAQDEVTGKGWPRAGRNEHGGGLWHMLDYGMRLRSARYRPYPARASPGQSWSKKGAHRASAMLLLVG